MIDDVTKQLDSLVDHLKRHIFAKWANRDGVQVQYHREKPLIQFKCVTDDKVVIEVTYDINQTSKEYIGNMVQGIRDHVVRVRQERHRNPIIVNTGRAANA
ncbi:hypothetical protein [Marinobacter sp. OP 3.4]|uniref:hypothetical protein n=1 Tax=Marinobacter sp. OP 3.4 TaxID=3076501 RepID=UPI002E221CFC